MIRAGALLLALIAGQAGAEALHPGAETYAYCTVCHGTQGRGNVAIGAPNIAVLAPWYLTRQLEAYRSGFRGTHEDDVIGVEMQPAAAALDDTQIAAAVDFASSFAATPAAPTIDGDLAAGERWYTGCAACHGEAGEGNSALGAPRLRGQSDWYLLRQLEAYRAGFRGAHPDDRWGPLMVPAAALLENQQAARDVVAYINSLPADGLD